MSRKQGTKQRNRTAYVNELKSDYRKLAIQANRRMTNLEKLAENPEYQAVLGYAYKNAMHDLEALTGESRFKHDIEKMSAKETDIRKLKALINVAKNFLDAPSSTKKGIDTTYRKRAKTINKKYGTDFDTDDMKAFFESAIWDKLKNRLGSQPAMIVIGKIQKDASNIIADIEDARESHKKITIPSLSDVEGLDVDSMLNRQDRKVIENLANIYSNRT